MYFPHNSSDIALYWASILNSIRLWNMARYGEIDLGKQCYLALLLILVKFTYYLLFSTLHYRLTTNLLAIVNRIFNQSIETWMHAPNTLAQTATPALFAWIRTIYFASSSITAYVLSFNSVLCYVQLLFRSSLRCFIPGDGDTHRWQNNTNKQKQ